MLVSFVTELLKSDKVDVNYVQVLDLCGTIPKLYEEVVKMVDCPRVYARG